MRMGWRNSTVAMIEATQKAPNSPRFRICGIDVTRITSRPATSVTMPRVPGTISSAMATVATSVLAAWGSPSCGSMTS
jgi:hypothetical protein